MPKSKTATRLSGAKIEVRSKPPLRDAEVRRLAKMAGCTPQMIRDVRQWGLGKNPSPERYAARYALYQAGWIPWC